MENLFFLKAQDTEINDKQFYKITILDMNNVQLFFIYKLRDAQVAKFIVNHKRFDDVSNELKFVIKRDNKIALDIK